MKRNKLEIHNGSRPGQASVQEYLSQYSNCNTCFKDLTRLNKHNLLARLFFAYTGTYTTVKPCYRSNVDPSTM